jgi:hypothetical protein
MFTKPPGQTAGQACFDMPALGECGHDFATVAPARFRERGDIAFQGDALVETDAVRTTSPLLDIAQAVARPARGS